MIVAGREEEGQLRRQELGLESGRLWPGLGRMVISMGKFSGRR